MTPMPFPRFYLIVDTARAAEEMMSVGVRLVQLRIKSEDATLLQSEIVSAQAAAIHHNAILVINDHWRLALDAGCTFVHLGQEDLDGADVPAIRRANVRLGISTHDDRELERALSFSPDYVALGPIYPTILKAMPWAPQGLQKLGEWKRRIGTVPLVGIGGLSVERARGAYDAGADSLAVVTDVSLHRDPKERAKEWLQVAREQS